MNKLVRGKTSLIIVSLAMIFISLLCTAGAVGLIVWGVHVTKESLVLAIILMVVGAIMAVMFFSGIVYGFILYFTGKSLVATNGSIKQENLGIGTAGVLKCKHCGTEVKKDDKFCLKCGESLLNTKKCPKCGEEINVDALVCSKCGEKLN